MHSENTMESTCEEAIPHDIVHLYVDLELGDSFQKLSFAKINNKFIKVFICHSHLDNFGPLDH